MELFYFFLWVFLIETIGIMSLPMVIYICKNLVDKGYSLSKLVGIMLLTYFSFLFSQVFGFGIHVILLSMFVIIVISLLILAFNLKRIVSIVKSRKFLRMFIFTEIIFLIAFTFFAVVRAYDPDILDGEKRMEFAFVNALVRAERIPPPYPWYSGESLGIYYYFGHFIVAILTVLSNIPSSITYNLSLAMFFALSILISLGIGLNLTKKFSYAMIFPFFVCIVANILIVLQILFFLFPNSFDLHIVGYTPKTEGTFLEKLFSTEIVWWSTRVIPWTVNEFPYFTFIWGDLHHSLMSIPFRLMLILLLLNFFIVNKNGFKIFGDTISQKVINLSILSLSLGFLIPLSTWDYPVMMLFAFLLFIVRQFHVNKGIRPLLNVFLVMFLIFLLSVAFLYPTLPPLFSKGRSKIILESAKTELYHFLILFSLFIYLILSFAYSCYKKIKVKNLGLILWLKLLICIVTVVIVLTYNFQILLVLVPLLFFSIYCVFTRKLKLEKKFVFVLIFMGCFLAIFCDVISIGSRYISLFKFYLQLWVFWALAAAYSIYYFRDWKVSKKRIVWTLFAITLIIACSIYPIVAGYVEVVVKNQYKKYLPTLDGTAYLKEEHSSDYNAIKWLNKHVKGTPIILEAPGRSYTYTSRVSWNTGLPTVLGWEHHVETHLNIPWSELRKTRNKDVDLIYNTTNNELALKLLKKYNIKYIFIGELEHRYDEMNIYVGNKIERKRYNKEGLEKFSRYPEFYKLVYNQSGVQIYEVIYGSDS